MGGDAVDASGLSPGKGRTENPRVYVDCLPCDQGRWVATSSTPASGRKPTGSVAVAPSRLGVLRPFEASLGAAGDSVRESAETKARRYLVEGRLEVQRVDSQSVLARFLGDEGDFYRVHWDEARSRWACSCPAYGPRCAHVLALARVVRKPPR